ncbi:hypothetical protein DDE82_007386 [Stemphylium lycopersici]|nr:hypothetical protein DDE82_007386 [Stemphylium lycopersici]
MVVHRVKSRVQFQYRNKQASQRNKHYAEPPKPQQTNNSPLSPQEAPKVYTFSVESDDPIYEDYIEPLEPEDTFFSKRRVSTREEEEISGAFKSQLSSAEVMSTASYRPNSSDRPDNCPSLIDTNSEPSDSLLMQAPLYMPNLEEYEWATQNEPKPAVEETKTDHSPKSWQDWIVNLFAGRRPSSSNRSNKSTTSSTATSFVIVEPVTPPPETAVEEEEDSTHSTTRPYQLKRLPLPEVIPTVRTATADNPTQRPNYRDIPPALMNPYIGYAVVAEDAFTPAIISRGFAAPASNPPTLRPLSQRRNNSANSLLDRHGDVWALWSEKTVAPDGLPFARPQAQEQICVQALLYPGSVARLCVCLHQRQGRYQNAEWPWVC